MAVCVSIVGIVIRRLFLVVIKSSNHHHGAATSSSSSSTNWTLQEFCIHQQRYNDSKIVLENLPLSSQQFMGALNLSLTHPFCTQYYHKEDEYYIPDIPRQGPLRTMSTTTTTTTTNSLALYIESLWLTFSIGCATFLPLLHAMLELGLRFAAYWILPFALCHLIYITFDESHSLSSSSSSSLSSSSSSSSSVHITTATTATATTTATTTTTTTATNPSQAILLWKWSAIISCICSFILATDDMYVQEWDGSMPGILLMMLTSLLTLRILQLLSARSKPISTIKSDNSSRWHQHQHNNILLYAVFVLCWIMLVGRISQSYIITTTTNPIANSTTATTTTTTTTPTIPLEGLYYDQQQSMIADIVQRWPLSQRSYSYDRTYPPFHPNTYQSHHHDGTTMVGASPWMMTGDARTAFPFLLNNNNNNNDRKKKKKNSLLSLVRVWLPLEDGEVVALDIAFPPGGHRSDTPIWLVFHGLNGSSDEEFVLDFIVRRIEEGCTCVVMIARGLMDHPIRGWNTFHGARWSDAHEAAVVLRQRVVLLPSSGAQVPSQLLAGIGFSMGAIVLANMVSQTGSHCALDIAVSVSGGLDIRYNIINPRAERLWQPMLAMNLRHLFLLSKWGERIRARLPHNIWHQFLYAHTVTEIDRTAVVYYHQFAHLEDYYSSMSVLGDIPREEHEEDTFRTRRRGRVDNISIPLLMIHAMDDPLLIWRTVAAPTGLMHPTNLCRAYNETAGTGTGSGKLLLLLTKRGGHVGWPLGWNPAQYEWQWMSNVPASFVWAYHESRRESVGDSTSRE
jgi:predicted alpha/beta-fold hydrolase